MEVLYHTRPYFVGIFPYIGLYGSYLQFRFLKWPLIYVHLWPAKNHSSITDPIHLQSDQIIQILQLSPSVNDFKALKKDIPIKYHQQNCSVPSLLNIPIFVAQVRVFPRPPRSVAQSSARPSDATRSTAPETHRLIIEWINRYMPLCATICCNYPQFLDVFSSYKATQLGMAMAMKRSMINLTIYIIYIYI